MSRTEMQRKQVDMSELAKSIIKELQEGSPSRQVEILVPDGLVANGDPQLLRIALVNLMGNAWKYTAKKAGAWIEFGAFQLRQAAEDFQEQGPWIFQDEAHSGFRRQA